jgi:preprotein translocase subunit SecA
MRSFKTGLRARDRAFYALSTARGVAIHHDLKEYRSIVAEIQAIDISPADTRSLTGRAVELHHRIAAGSDPDGELPECFALVAAACQRALGFRPFDEQLIAGIAMHRGMLAQMQTGEGKTLAAVFPACLNAMRGTGMHVLTANDYLARRDARWMGPVYDILGLEAAAIGADTPGPDRRRAYRADVTYLTAQEAGFDYLRDGMCLTPERIVHRGMGMAIVDEADFILIDEARVPLVIAGAADADDVDVAAVDLCAHEMILGEDFTIDREARRILLRPSGHKRVEDRLGVAGIHEEKGAECFARVYAALHAHNLLKRDVDYVVKDRRIELVDGFTGRLADRRQWPWGIQSALEAKEGVPLSPEGTVYGSITIQHFVSHYEKLAAMTATAVPSAAELAESYGLQTVIIPTVMPVVRVDRPGLVFKTRVEKAKALVAEIAVMHARGRPILVGTGSVLESRELAAALAAQGISCEVLNASNDEREAGIIAAAGRLGALTISTNMAGRGTDIRLADDRRVFDAGGLYVLGTNRHESRRIDDQLRGRAGRQGEPGESRFFISLEDSLFERFGVREFLPKGADLDDPRVLREIDRAQSIIEGQNHAIRRTLAKYSLLVELEREAVRTIRDDALLRDVLPLEVEGVLPCPEARHEAIIALLCLLDRFWADHLLLVEEVREGINLERFAGRDPSLEYIRRVGRAFDEGMAAATTALVVACQQAREDPEALSLQRVGVRMPASTWTYQIDDEVPIRLSLASGALGAAALVAAPFVLLGVLGAGASALAKILRRITFSTRPFHRAP